MTSRRPAGPILAGLALLAVAVAVLVAATAIPGKGGYSTSGPRFVPLVVGAGLVAFAVLFLARATVLPDRDLLARAAEESRATHWPTPILLMVALVAYALLLEPLGYIVATTGFFVPVTRLLGSPRMIRDGVVGLVLAGGLFVAFTRFLGVSLPAGLTPLF